MEESAGGSRGGRRHLGSGSSDVTEACALMCGREVKGMIRVSGKCYKMCLRGLEPSDTGRSRGNRNNGKSRGQKTGKSGKGPPGRPGRGGQGRTGEMELEEEEEELAAEEELLADEDLQAFYASMGFDVDEITIVQGDGQEITADITGGTSSDSTGDSPSRR